MAELEVETMNQNIIAPILSPIQSPIIVINPITDEQRDIIIASQMQCVIAKINKNIFDRVTPTQEIVESYTTSIQEQINAFKEKFSCYPNYNDYVDVIAIKFDKRLKKLSNEIKEFNVQHHEECIKYLKDLETKLETDEKLQNIYITLDETGLKEYIKSAMQNACANLHISFDKLGDYFPELQLSLNKLLENMNKRHDAITSCQEQFNAYISKFNEELTKAITNMRVTTFSDEQEKEWDKNVVKINDIYSKALNRKLKKIDKSMIPESVFTQYTTDVKTIYSEIWEREMQNIRVHKNRELLERIKDLEMPEELKISKKIKKFDEKDLIECQILNSILKSDYEFLLKVVGRCQQSICYIGRVFQVEEDEIVEVQLTKLLKCADLKLGVYSLNAMRDYTHSEIQIDKIFDTIEVKDTHNSNYKIYVFSPDETDIFSNYVSILKCLENRKSVEKGYEIKFSEIIASDT